MSVSLIIFSELKEEKNSHEDILFYRGETRPGSDRTEMLCGNQILTRSILSNVMLCYQVQM